MTEADALRIAQMNKSQVIVWSNENGYEDAYHALSVAVSVLADSASEAKERARCEEDAWSELRSGKTK